MQLGLRRERIFDDELPKFIESAELGHASSAIGLDSIAGIVEYAFTFH